MTNRQNGFAWVLIIVIVAVGLGAGWWVKSKDKSMVTPQVENTPVAISDTTPPEENQTTAVFVFG